MSRIRSAASTTPADTVVLIHGLMRSRRSMWMVGAWLRCRGYRVVHLSYPSLRVSIAEAVSGTSSHGWPGWRRS